MWVAFVVTMESVSRQPGGFLWDPGLMRLFVFIQERKKHFSDLKITFSGRVTQEKLQNHSNESSFSN